MNFKKVLGLFTALLLALNFSVLAQDDNIADAMLEIGEDAAKGWFGPAVTLFGVGMNSGWYNSSKSLSMFKMPVGISVASVNIALMGVDDNLRFFDFEGSLPAAPIMDPIAQGLGASSWDALLAPLPANQRESLKEINFSVPDVPTVLGPKERKSVTIAELFQSYQADNPAIYTALFDPAVGLLRTQGSQTVTLPFFGLDVPSTMISPAFQVTSLTIGVKEIPGLDNIQLGIRFMPTLSGSDMEFSWWGFKLQHEITPHLPMMSSIPFLHTNPIFVMILVTQVLCVHRADKTQNN